MRQFKQKKGEILNHLSIIQTVALAVLMGLFFLDVGYTEADIHDRLGIIFFMVILWFFTSWFSAVNTCTAPPFFPLFQLALLALSWTNSVPVVFLLVISSTGAAGSQ